MSKLVFEIEDEERQMIVLALAKLSLYRPGWLHAIRVTVAKLRSGQLFEDFRMYGPDRIEQPVIERAAAAIANARANRRGAPDIENVLSVLPEKLRGEVLEDATRALKAAIDL